MDAAEFERLEISFRQFHAESAPAFGRKQWRERSQDYLRGLLVQAVVYELLPRKHWTPAEFLEWMLRIQGRNQAAQESHARRRARKRQGESSQAASSVEVVVVMLGSNPKRGPMLPENVGCATDAHAITLLRRASREGNHLRTTCWSSVDGGVSAAALSTSPLTAARLRS